MMERQGKSGKGKAAKKAGKGKGFDVVCVGSATVDCFVDLPVDFSRIKHGSKIMIENISILTGGGGSNAAVGLARMGLKTGFIGELGHDISADIIRNDLSREGVDFLVRRHSRHRTAYSVVLESKGKDRAILVHKGASSFLHPDEIPKEMRTGWFYFASVMGASFRTMERLAGFAKRKGIKVYFNPSSYMVKQGRDFLRKVLSVTTILSLNKEEAQMLLKSRTGDVRKLLLSLHALGPGICIITDGSRGAHLYDGKCFHSIASHRIAARDTTGAGDAFGTGFLAGFILTESAPDASRMKSAMRLALANSESVIRQVGAKTGLLRRRAVQDLLSQAQKSRSKDKGEKKKKTQKKGKRRKR